MKYSCVQVCFWFGTLGENCCNQCPFNTDELWKDNEQGDDYGTSSSHGVYL